MSSIYKPRSSDEALAEHFSLQRANQRNTTTVNGVVPGMATTLPRNINGNTENPRQANMANTTGIYIIGGGNDSTTYHNNANNSSPTTFDRKQQHRRSWLSMRRKDDNCDFETGNTLTLPVLTPSPQTTRSYISTVSTGTTLADSGGGGSSGTASVGVGGGSGGGGGSISVQSDRIGRGTTSGRTTATSGHISTTSGIITLSGSNDTLNDIHSDYHSNDLPDVGAHFRGDGIVEIVAAVMPETNFTTHNNSSFNIANGSTVKLVPATPDDEENQLTKCSVFRSLVLCICINVSYANVVRFPRELDRYGSAYLIPYLTLLCLVGLPMILLEISVGQFLGQGAAHTWRASPIFQGACIVSRFASWLSTVWISLQALLALAYIGSFASSGDPMRECANLKLNSNGYSVDSISGQECLQITFLTPFWKNPLYFGLLSAGLICIWIVIMLCTHSSNILRRSLFVLGLVGFTLLCCLTGWEVRNSIARDYFPELWPFEPEILAESHIWFNALMQVLFSVNCGFGALPVLTGNFLYKGDAVRTSIVYLFFNLLVNAIAVTLFMVQFDLFTNSGYMIDELKPLTAIYDRIHNDTPDSELLQRLIPSLIYALVVITALVSATVAIYTATCLVPRRPSCVICLIATVVAIISFSAPKFIIARILDTRIVGTMIITALVFELIAITWIYGAKNIYTDLEFSIGRPIFRVWMSFWCICPAILTGILVWWCADDDQYDLMATYMPRWAPIIFALLIIMIVASIQISRQVEYNFFGMICEASKSAKEWGPADPLARLAWRQWRSVCQDTGTRDFTLRRRGTRDYTHSIKKGQYSTSNKYANGSDQAAERQQHPQQQDRLHRQKERNHLKQQDRNHQNQQHQHQQQEQQQKPHWKSSTPGDSSPNYSGSMFGDSAFEEDISVDKFPGISHQFVPFQTNDGKPLRYSHRTRERERDHEHERSSRGHQIAQPQMHMERVISNQSEKHREIVYIRRLSDSGGNVKGNGNVGGLHATRIEITPSNESITYGPSGNGGIGYGTRNPLGRSTGCLIAAGSASNSTPNGIVNIKRSASSVVSVYGHKLPPPTTATAGDHICWRKFNVNPEEYSTEL